MPSRQRGHQQSTGDLGVGPGRHLCVRTELRKATGVLTSLPVLDEVADAREPVLAVDADVRSDASVDGGVRDQTFTVREAFGTLCAGKGLFRSVLEWERGEREE